MRERFESTHLSTLSEDDLTCPLVQDFRLLEAVCTQNRGSEYCHNHGGRLQDISDIVISANERGMCQSVFQASLEDLLYTPDLSLLDLSAAPNAEEPASQ